MNRKIPHLKVSKLVDSIEASLRELASLTGEEHISAFIIGGNFSLLSYNKHGETGLDIYRGGTNNGENS